ncbi:unnamed protein product [Leptosia nina]|uniref:Uncharacterized protein n=1 Tax=Leptosia nina TaxID=320188 RepID=A0AAV1IYL2_9NEOP
MFRRAGRCRCLWPLRRPAHRELTREIAVRPRRVLPKSISKPANEVRETTSKTTLTTDCQFASDRTTILREASRKDPHRNSHPRHAPLWKLLLLALHGDHVTFDVASASGGLIHTLRLPAVPTWPAHRLPVPRRIRGRCDVIQRGPRRHDRARRLLREEQRQRCRSLSHVRVSLLPS